MSALPQRDGWVTGVLATYPACPPFPEFTAFESAALNTIASSFGADEAEFRRQLSAAKVIDRINSLAGFYTHVTVDRSVAQPVPIDGKGGHFAVTGVECGLGIVLWGKEGYLETIEGYSVVKDALRDRKLASLQLASLEKLF